MNARNPVATATAGLAVLALAGCNVLGDDSSDDGMGSDSKASPVADEMRSWEPCEVLEGLQPIIDFMGIVEVDSSDGELAGAMHGDGMDGEALTCFGLVVVSEYETIYDETKSNGGEISVGIIPWDTEEEAELSYEERTGPDQERRTDQGENFELVDREDLASST